MITPAIILVHGYTGSVDDLAPLAHFLRIHLGDDAVHLVRLPGHDGDLTPAFDPGLYEKAIAHVVSGQVNRRPIILLGHSTGGCLALGYLLKARLIPDLLILAGTPAGVTGRDLERWEHHRSGQGQIPLGDTARMVSYINRMGRAVHPNSFPVLVLRGGDDTLVASNAGGWDDTCFAGTVRHITIPKAGHHLFRGPGSPVALDCVHRAVSDLCRQSGPEDWAAVAAVDAMETGATCFVGADSSRARHFAQSPAVARALGDAPRFTPVSDTDPFQINIEVTSRCNLACSHCARSRYRRSAENMELDAFRYLLDLVPNTFRVVIVGLGEPTLHPDLVALAAQRDHDVGMVTNAMNLEKQLSQELIAAGLRKLTFSLDSVDEETAELVRRGSDLPRIRQNILDFQGLAHGQIPTAVFTAVSCETVWHLPELASAVADLGVNAWMLSDMNFDSNQSISLRASWNRKFRDALGKALNAAFNRQLPVLSVRGLEEIGLRRRYSDFLVMSPAEPARRSQCHRWCLSPWQTLPVDVHGNATVCDCRPDAIIGNLFHDGFDDIWNGEALQRHRMAMQSEQPPGNCLICPRF